MSTGEDETGEQRVRDPVGRHARTRAFAEAEDVISVVLSAPGVQEAREGWRRWRRRWAWSWGAPPA
ncbi:hypothetical protein ACWHAN_31410 [Streptomyces albidoflavus]|uniref:hypothetical protein n=1 Tax=Streptomyces sp. DT197 TaxID=3393417 RepID=UPI0036290FC1